MTPVLPHNQTANLPTLPADCPQEFTSLVLAVMQGNVHVVEIGDTVRVHFGPLTKMQPNAADMEFGDVTISDAGTFSMIKGNFIAQGVTVPANKAKLLEARAYMIKSGIILKSGSNCQ